MARDVSPYVTSSCVLFFCSFILRALFLFVCLCTCAGLLCIADIFAVNRRINKEALNGIEVHCNFDTCKFRLVL